MIDTVGLKGGIINGAKVKTELAAPIQVLVILSKPSYTVKYGNGVPYLYSSGTMSAERISNAVITSATHTPGQGSPVITTITSDNAGGYAVGVKMGSAPGKYTIDIAGSAEVIVPHITETDQFEEKTITLDLGKDVCFKHSQRDTDFRCDWGDQIQNNLNIATNKDVYSVLPEVIVPGILLVDDNKRLTRAADIQFNILPKDYDSSMSYLVVFENEDVYTYQPVTGFSDGAISLQPGSEFDIAKTYEAKLFLNYGRDVEIRSGKVDLSVTQLIIELLDSNGNPTTTEAIGKDENFVSWKTLTIRYKVLPESIQNSDYFFTLTPVESSKAGHPYLGMIDTDNPNFSFYDDGVNKILSLNPVTIDSQKSADSRKAKPLAFDLAFNLNNQVVKTFHIEQSYKNAIREEYMVYSSDYSNITAADMPTLADFAGGLSPANLVNNAYDAADVPHGAKLEALIGLLPANQYTMTSNYRNPYRNQYAQSLSVTSRHVWSGAIDLQDANGSGQTSELKTLWNTIKDYAQYGKVLVEGNDVLVQRFLNNYIANGLHKVIVDGSLVFTMPDAHSNGYNIVWSKAAGWKTVTYSYTEIVNGNPIPCTNQQYTFKEADWDQIAINLHVQDLTDEGWWGF